MEHDNLDNGKDFWMADGPNDLLAVPGRSKKRAKPKKMEFVGWGSRQLIGFLNSIGRDTSKEIPHYDVTTIIEDYIKANNLTQRDKKKKILCDERLFFLFGKKSFSRNKINEFLEKHLAENQSDSDDEFLYSSDENDKRDGKRQKSASNSKDIQTKKNFPEIPKSRFAAIIPANVKLLYLKKSLVEELHKDEETFEKKLVGSYVRAKSNPNDYLQKNSHQLLLVTGVKKPSGATTTCSDILFEAADRTDDICISMLSDGNFSEEEIEDLRERINNGSLKRPTTVEFQEKALLLHEDITKHWLDRELHLLQNQIDRANEKGWRKEFCEYYERQELLKTPAEQNRLLLEVPKVIAEELKEEPKPVDGSNDSPKSIIRLPSLDSSDDSEPPQAEATLEIDISKTPGDEEAVQLVGMQTSSVDPQQKEKVETKFVPTTAEVVELSDDDDDGDDFIDKPGSSMWHYLDPQGTLQGPHSLDKLKAWSDANFFPPDFKVFVKTGQFHPYLLSKLRVRN